MRLDTMSDPLNRRMFSEVHGRSAFSYRVRRSVSANDAGSVLSSAAASVNIKAREGGEMRIFRSSILEPPVIAVRFRRCSRRGC